MVLPNGYNRQSRYSNSLLKSIRNCLDILAVGLMLLIGSIALVNFVINLKAMFLLRSAFVDNTDWTLDFQRITQWMLAKVLTPTDWNNPQLTNIDFFNRTYAAAI